jgi:3-oxoacyl-[acyl-carrier-protein] synthase-3
VILEAEQNPQGLKKGIISSVLRSDGAYHDLLFTDGGPSTTQTAGKLRMQGQEVFKMAVGKVSGVIFEVLEAANMQMDQVDWFVPHQANKRIIDATARKVGLDADKVIMTIENHANTSAASIPLALNQAARSGKFKRGDVILLEAMGGGFTWGAVLLNW